MSFCFEYCVVRGLCVGLISRSEEPNRMWCVCDREASTVRRPWPTGGLSRHKGGGGCRIRSTSVKWMNSAKISSKLHLRET